MSGSLNPTFSNSTVCIIVHSVDGRFRFYTKRFLLAMLAVVCDASSLKEAIKYSSPAHLAWFEPGRVRTPGLTHPACSAPREFELELETPFWRVGVAAMAGGIFCLGVLDRSEERSPSLLSAPLSPLLPLGALCARSAV